MSKKDLTLEEHISEIKERYADRIEKIRKRYDDFLEACLDAFRSDLDDEDMKSSLSYYHGYGGRETVALRTSAIERELSLTRDQVLQLVVKAVPQDMFVLWDTMGKGWIIYP